VDSPETSEALRTQLSLPFPLLCDTEHRIISDWNILNARERGGIARPAVFVLNPGLIIRFAATDQVVRRVPAAEIVALLQQPSGTRFVRRKLHLPLLSHLIQAIRNNFRRTH
jgi:peroxiredoxin